MDLTTPHGILEAGAKTTDTYLLLIASDKGANWEQYIQALVNKRDWNAVKFIIQILVDKDYNFSSSSRYGWGYNSRDSITQEEDEEDII